MNHHVVRVDLLVQVYYMGTIIKFRKLAKYVSARDTKINQIPGECLFLISLSLTFDNIQRYKS